MNAGRLRLSFDGLREALGLPSDVAIRWAVTDADSGQPALILRVEGSGLPLVQEGMLLPLVEAEFETDSLQRIRFVRWRSDG